MKRLSTSVFTQSGRSVHIKYRARSEGTLPALARDFGKRLRYVFVSFPEGCLAAFAGPSARPCCSGDAGGGVILPRAPRGNFQLSALGRRWWHTTSLPRAV